MGNSAGYKDLEKTPGAHNYRVGPKESGAVEIIDLNGEWIKLSKVSMLPGRSAARSTDDISHYVIIAYTVQPGEGGEARIVNSQIQRVLVKGSEKPPSPISIYVNDKLIGSDNVKGYEPFAFDVPLGRLSAGDTVYIAYGCPEDSNPSTANLQFQIEVGD